MAQAVQQKYPLHILKLLREQQGLDENDSSMDHKLMSMSKRKAFREVLAYDGLFGGYDRTIKDWILSIYGIDLDTIK